MAQPTNLGNPAAIIASNMVANKLSKPASSSPVRGLQMNAEQQKVIGWTLIGLGGLGISFVAFKIFQGIVRRSQQKSTVNKIDDYGSTSDVAQDIYNGINPYDDVFGWGTDEILIRNTIRKKVPHLKFWDQVKIKYHRLSKGRSLMSDLEKDLSNDEWLEIKMILRNKPANAREARNQDKSKVTQTQVNSWAERIKAAADYTQWWIFDGVDEEAIYAVFEDIPLVAVIPFLDKAYRIKYHKTLLSEITTEMSREGIKKIYLILKDKPDAKNKNIVQIFTQK